LRCHGGKFRSHHDPLPRSAIGDNTTQQQNEYCGGGWGGDNNSGVSGGAGQFQHAESHGDGRHGRAGMADQVRYEHAVYVGVFQQA